MSNSLPGPPLSHNSAITELLENGVNVAIGVVDEYAARNTRFDLAWVGIVPTAAGIILTHITIM